MRKRTELLSFGNLIWVIPINNFEIFQGKDHFSVEGADNNDKCKYTHVIADKFFGGLETKMSWSQSELAGLMSETTNKFILGMENCHPNLDWLQDWCKSNGLSVHSIHPPVYDNPR